MKCQSSYCTYLGPSSTLISCRSVDSEALATKCSERLSDIV